MDLDLSARPKKYKTSGPVPKSTACSRRKRLRKIKMATNNTHSVITFVQYLFLCKMLIVFLFIPFQNIGHSYENGQASNHQPLLHDDSPASWDYHMEWNISVERNEDVQEEPVQDALVSSNDDSPSVSTATGLTYILHVVSHQSN